MKMKKQLCGVLLALVTALPVSAVERNPYFGISVGPSRLAPNVEGSDYTLDKSTSTAFSVTLGLPITNRINGELGYTELGEAALSQNEMIGYSAFSIGGIAYLLGNDARLRVEPGLRGYVRLGFNIMENEHDIPLTQADNTAIWAGAGLEWPLGERLRVRGELASFDGDAQALTLGLLYQPGARRARGPVSANTPDPVATTPPTTSAPKPTIVEPMPTIEPAPTTEAQPSVELVEQPKEETPAVVPVPKSGVLSGAEFEPGTAVLTAIGKKVVDRLAIAMLTYPELFIEIGAHTDGVKGDPNKMSLTRKRAIAVARQLVGGGISVKRLKAKSYGANLPREQGNTVGANRLNNRIEIVVR